MTNDWYGAAIQALLHLDDEDIAADMVAETRVLMRMQPEDGSKSGCQAVWVSGCDL